MEMTEQFKTRFNSILDRGLRGISIRSQLEDLMTDVLQFMDEHNITEEMKALGLMKNAFNELPYTTQGYALVDDGSTRVLYDTVRFSAPDYIDPPHYLKEYIESRFEGRTPSIIVIKTPKLIDTGRMRLYGSNILGIPSRIPNLVEDLGDLSDEEIVDMIVSNLERYNIPYEIVRYEGMVTPSTMAQKIDSSPHLEQYVATMNDFFGTNIGVSGDDVISLLNRRSTTKKKLEEYGRRIGCYVNSNRTKDQIVNDIVSCIMVGGRNVVERYNRMLSNV